jgi:hypothetical protein
MAAVDLSAHLDANSKAEGVVGLRMGLSVALQPGSSSGPARSPAKTSPVPGTTDLGSVLLYAVQERY